MDETDAYFERIGPAAYAARRATESPWSRTQQHGGPPLALAAHAMLGAYPSATLRPASVALDFLGAVPLAEVSVETSQLRAGSRIDLLEARLSAGGRPFAVARTWRVRRDETLAVPPSALRDLPAPALPPAQPQHFFAGVAEDWGYGRSIEWRFVRGAMGGLGPKAVWTRVRLPLVAGEAEDAIARSLVIADSANGISAELPMTEWLFVPTGIVVTYRRDPAGEWLLLDAETTLGPDGRAICRATISDAGGAFATVDQALFVGRR